MFNNLNIKEDSDSKDMKELSSIQNSESSLRFMSIKQPQMCPIASPASNPNASSISELESAVIDQREREQKWSKLENLMNKLNKADRIGNVKQENAVKKSPIEPEKTSTLFVKKSPLELEKTSLFFKYNQCQNTQNSVTISDVKAVSHPTISLVSDSKEDKEDFSCPICYKIMAQPCKLQ